MVQPGLIKDHEGSWDQRRGVEEVPSFGVKEKCPRDYRDRSLCGS